MKNSLISKALILLSLIPFFLNGQSQQDSAGNSSYYRISEAYYFENDSTTVLDNWIEQGTRMRFIPVKDSIIISIDIGSDNKVFFAGMAVGIKNPGFKSGREDTEFYHWTFISHIKEGIRDAYISKEYIEGSLEKLGRKYYTIHIAFPDQTEFLFYANEPKSRLRNP